MSYHGWKNYQTWNVSLWMNNDEGLYNLMQECRDYEEFREALRDSGMIETPDGVAFNDSGLDIDALDEVIEEAKGIEED